ncbi:MAG: alpha/beta fold hydrolase [Rhodobacteraceae bacterium]|nr:MAG: alpha/beta fold hydrolase [Paracoccaceae bacterium]
MTAGLDALDRGAAFWAAAAALARAPAVEIGETPADPVFRRDKTVLRRYRPIAAASDRAPVVIVHGLVGRATMTDLDADRSLVRALLARGVATHVVDWGRPSRADRFLRFEDFVCDHLAAVVAAVTRAEGRRPALFGICQGGIFALCLGALAPGAAAGLALAVTPVDFDADADAPLVRWARAFGAAEVERLIDAFGYLPGGVMGAVFQALTPAKTSRKYTLDLLDVARDPGRLALFLRMERWLADRPDHPGEAAKQLVIELYQRNALARGAFRLDGAPVRLSDIRAPVLALYGLRDHIAPPACCRALGPLLDPATPYAEQGLDAGHIGVFVSGRARRALAAALLDWLATLGD